MREYPASFEEHLGKVTQTQFVPKAPKDDEQDDVSRVFKVVELGAAAFVEALFAVSAAQ